MQGQQRHLADVQAEISYRQEYLHGKADALHQREAVLTTREDTLLRTAAQRPLYAGETVVLVRDLFFEDTGADPVLAGTHAIVTKIPGDRPGSHCEVRTITTQRVFDVGARDIERIRAPLPGGPPQAAAAPHDALLTAPLGGKHLPSPLPHTPLQPQQPPAPQQQQQQQQQPAPPLQARSVSGISARHSAEGSSVARADNQIDRFWMGQKGGGGGGQEVYVPKQRGAAAAHLPACGTAAVPGARRALVIGVDYAGTPHAVPQHLGTEAAKQAAAMLASKRFEGETRVLAERQAAHLRPTKRNILASVAWLVDGARDGDVLFFSFCGHSLMEEDLPTSPSERFHQCVAPSDYLQSGYLYVSELFEHFLRLPHGVKLTCLFDTDPGILLPAKYRIASSGETGVNTDTAAGTPHATIYALSSCPIQKIQARLSGQRTASAPQTTGVLTPAFCTAMQWRGAATTVRQLLEDVRHMMQGRVSGGTAAEIVVTSSNACSMPDVFTLAHLTPVEDERRVRAWSARLAEERGRLEAVESKVSGKRASARDRDSLSSSAAAAAAAAGASSYAPFAAQVTQRAPPQHQQQHHRPSKQQQLPPEQQLSRQQRDVAASNRIVMDLYDVI